MNRRQNRPQPYQRQNHRNDGSHLQRPDILPHYLPSTQKARISRSPAKISKIRRYIVYFCGAALTLFLLSIFILREQVFAPSAVVTEAALNVNTTIRSADAAAMSDTNLENDTVADEQAADAISSSTEQLGAISLEELIGDSTQEPALTVEDATAALSVSTEVAPDTTEQSENLATQPELTNGSGNIGSGNNSVTNAGDNSDTIVSSRVVGELQQGTQFYIEKQVSNEKVPNIIFSIRSAEVTAQQLILTAAFENVATKATRFSRIDAVPLEQIQLSDGTGRIYQAQAADQTLLSIQPENGFAPNGANIGTISFALPAGPGPFTIGGIHDYPVIEITTDMYANATASLPTVDPLSLASVPDGNYDIYTQVLSSLEELEPLVLHIRTIDLTQDAINVHIGFSNNTLQQFGLLSGPSGENAWLLDRVHRQYAPYSVSDSLRNLITPEEGIAPGAEHQGTLTFPRPADLSELQFVLEPYSPITVRFGPAGLSAVQNTGDPLTENGQLSSADPGVQAYREISALLNESARAVMEQDEAAYLATVSESIRPLHSYFFNRLSRLPKSDFQMKLLFPPQLKGIDVQRSDTISTPTLDAQIRYNLSNISVDNPFVFDFSADFARVDGRWMITNLAPKRNQPFWWGQDFFLYETAHFLIFTRPDSVQNLQTLQAEVEVAYATLTALGIPLEQKYVAYFTGAEDSLYALTGMANTNLVGVALSRYDINGIDRNTGQRTINAINRAFYVNSEQFALNSAAGNPVENSILRQSIITHELVHLAFSHDARPFTPPWISEGTAVYYSDQFALDSARVLALEGQFDQLNLTELTGLETLGDHDIIGQQTEMRYIYSGAAIRYLIETYGEAQVQTLFRAYASVPADYIEARMPAEQDAWTTRSVFSAMSLELTNDYVLSYFGLTLPELDQRIKEWLRNGP